MSRSRDTALLLALALVGWALCGATVGIGRAVTTMRATLIVHAGAAPVFFAGLTVVYYRLGGAVSPPRLAAAFLGVVIGLDLFVVASLIERSFEMFASVLGTWIPFGLIFAATYLTGRVATGNASRRIGTMKGQNPSSELDAKLNAVSQ